MFYSFFSAQSKNIVVVFGLNTNVRTKETKTLIDENLAHQPPTTLANVARLFYNCNFFLRFGGLKQKPLNQEKISTNTKIMLKNK